MMDIGEEALSMAKENFGIKMEYYSMKGNGNVVSLMVLVEFTINGDN